jgi:hypothetical protein
MGTEMIEDLFNGYNSCILCYGQTGSGKTFSMFGENGIVLESLDLILKINKNYNFNIEIGAVQIYMENVYDLLDNNTKVQGVSIN